MLGKIFGGWGRNHQDSKSKYLGGFLLPIFEFLWSFLHLTLSLWQVHNCCFQPSSQTLQGLLLNSCLSSLFVVPFVEISQRIA